MGQLEEAAVSKVTHPAPWEGATPEEDMAYDQAVQFGDMEFEAEVGNYMGPYGREALDADRATMLREGGWTVRGTNIVPEYATDPETKELIDKRYGKVFRKAGEEIEADMVYAVGPENAEPELWAHEFLHRYRHDKGMRALGGEERFIRLFSAYRAQTPDQWIRAVDMWRDQTIRPGESMNLKEAEKHLKRSLDTWKSDFIRIEAEAAERKGDRPKTREWMFMDLSSLKSDYRELAEGREGIRDLNKSSHYQRILQEKDKDRGSAQALQEAARKFREEQDRRNQDGLQN